MLMHTVHDLADVAGHGAGASLVAKLTTAGDRSGECGEATQVAQHHCVGDAKLQQVNHGVTGTTRGDADGGGHRSSPTERELPSR
jgi:hypothetical protein